MAMIEMTVEGIGIDPQNNPLVLLRDGERSLFVPIWIGPAEAVSIQMELDQKQPQRPMTHDLIVNVLQQLGAQLSKVSVHDFSDSVYYATLHLSAGRDQTPAQEIDARPSDAIALALRTGAPIWVAEDVVAKTAIQVEETQPEEAQPLALPEHASETSPPQPEELDRLSRLLEGLDLDPEKR